MRFLCARDDRMCVKLWRQKSEKYRASKLDIDEVDVIDVMSNYRIGNIERCVCCVVRMDDEKVSVLLRNTWFL